jgi:hypothetical protein
MGPVGEPMHVAPGEPIKRSTGTVIYAPPATRPPMSPAAAIYDFEPCPLKDFVLVAPRPDVPAVLELAS